MDVGEDVLPSKVERAREEKEEEENDRGIRREIPFDIRREEKKVKDSCVDARGERIYSLFSLELTFE